MSKTFDDIVAIQRIERESAKNKRQNCNREILREISNYIETYPDLRFVQILHIMHIVENGKDFFNEEPSDTLERIRR